METCNKLNLNVKMPIKSITLTPTHKKKFQKQINIPDPSLSFNKLTINVLIIMFDIVSQTISPENNTGENLGFLSLSPNRQLRSKNQNL